VKLRYTAAALDDLDRPADFLLDSDPDEAAATGELIIEALQLLKHHPHIGRPASAGLRELVISRGRSGYLALYAIDPVRDVVHVLRIRHQREAGDAG
jgi:plasmid stabilization system protein ParE